MSYLFISMTGFYRVFEYDGEFHTFIIRNLQFEFFEGGVAIFAYFYIDSSKDLNHDWDYSTNMRFVITNIVLMALFALWILWRPWGRGF